MKLLYYTTFTADISSSKGNFMQEINVKAKDIDEALAISKQFAETLGGEVSRVAKSYFTCIEPSTKTITIEV